MRLYQLTVCCAALLCCADNAITAEPINKASLSLQIALPFGEDDTRQIDVFDDQSFFPIVVTNNSSKDQYIWQSNNSWGYGCLFFNVLTDDGEVAFTIKKQQKDWTANMPATLRLKPGGQHVLNVYLNSSVWKMKFLKDYDLRRQIPLTLQAVYEVKPPDSSIDVFWPPGKASPFKSRLWTGKIQSARSKFLLGYWVDSVETRDGQMVPATIQTDSKNKSKGSNKSKGPGLLDEFGNAERE